MGIYLLHLLKQNLAAFVDLVYMRGLKKALAFWHFCSMKCSSHVGWPPSVTTFRDQNMVKHGGHRGISFLFIDWTKSNL